MISDLVIEGFRGFERMELHELGRINLLVGTNNCGKTSILEAIRLLRGDRDPAAIVEILSSRGESMEPQRHGTSREPDVRYLFNGRSLELGRQLRITEDYAGQSRSLTMSIAERTPAKPEESSWGLLCDWQGARKTSFKVPLSLQGGLMPMPLPPRPESAATAIVVPANGLTAASAIRQFESLVLTPKEGIVVDALRIIEPDVERLATKGADWRLRDTHDRGGIIVKTSDCEEPLPIGSLGDGMWRMFGLALALASADGGVLLIDEVDSGLHFQVMERMWKLINETSRRLSVQVFATTHSRDAYESLAVIAREDVSEGSEITIQRINRAKGKSISFNEQEIIAAAEHGIEVR